MTVVYVQKNEDGEWTNENTFSAARGFYNRGYEVRSFTADELRAGALSLTRETIVAGGINEVREALKQLGVIPPTYETYPHSLRRFMDRNPQFVTMGTVMEAAQTPGFRPCFVKPAQDHKLFTGLVIRQYADLLKVAHVPETCRVYKMPAIEWLSEYRAFIHRGELLDLRPYKGDPLVFPDPKVVKQIVKTAKSTLSHVAYALDIGVARFPERPEVIRTPTLLVEANDAHSLGAYGLSSHLYTQMIEDRWKQMIETGY